MTPPSVPRLRASKPKVRSGCRGCKRRRIKCDETQPDCQRCRKAGLQCRYDQPNSRRDDGRPLRDIRPAAATTTMTTTTTTTSNDNDAKLKLAPGPSSSVMTAAEAVYFDTFRNSVVANFCLSGYTDLWSRTVLRESMRDDCVRDCVLGIGALYRSMLYENRQVTPDPAPLWKPPAQSSLNRYLRDAINFYARSISKFRTRLACKETPTSPRTMLIVSVLFVVYELMQGNIESVDRVMHASILALKDSLVCLKHELGRGSQTDSALDDEGVRDAEYMLPRLAVAGACSSPLYPSQWDSSAYHKIQALKFTVPDWKSNTRQIEYAFNEYSTCLLWFAFSTFQGTVLGHPLEPQKLQEEEATISCQTKEWCHFMQEKLRQDEDPVQRRTWKLMLSMAKVYGVFSGYYENKEDEERVRDSRADEAREAVLLIESVIDEWVPASTLPPPFEDKLLPALRCVARCCRDLQVRLKALVLCERLTGPWVESRAITIGTEVLVAIEEEGRDENGYIPLDSRYRWSAATWNEDHTAFRMTITGTVTGVEKHFTVRHDGRRELNLLTQLQGGGGTTTEDALPETSGARDLQVLARR